MWTITQFFATLGDAVLVHLVLASVAAVGGELNVSSPPGGSTTVRASIPLS